MSDYIDEGLSKRGSKPNRPRSVLTRRADQGESELRHGDWIAKVRSKLYLNPFSNARFALLVVFVVLFVGSVFLFENMDILPFRLVVISTLISGAENAA
jgi:hypothetical protein